MEAKITNEEGKTIGKTDVDVKDSNPEPETKKETALDKFKKSWIWRNRGKVGAILGSVGTVALMAILGRGNDDDGGSDE